MTLEDINNVFRDTGNELGCDMVTFIVLKFRQYTCTPNCLLMILYLVLRLQKISYKYFDLITKLYRKYIVQPK